MKITNLNLFLDNLATNLTVKEPEFVKAKPFLKWQGGKHNILPELESRLPKQYDVYYEPFLGAGSLFFKIQPTVPVFLSDINDRLINTYIGIRDHLEEVLGLFVYYRNHNSEEFYYKIREEFNQSCNNPVKKAVNFLYLNRTGMNGLYRVNQQGQYNVSAGTLTRCGKQFFTDYEKVIRRASAALKSVELASTDYLNTPIVENAFYYLDPPYENSEVAVKYDTNKFHITELADMCRRIDQKNSKFMLSNNNTEQLYELFSGYNIEIVRSPRLGSPTGQRKKVEEIIVRNY